MSTTAERIAQLANEKLHPRKTAKGTHNATWREKLLAALLNPAPDPHDPLAALVAAANERINPPIPRFIRILLAPPAASASIIDVQINPSSSTAGTAQDVAVVVNTANIPDGAAVTANLLDASSNVQASACESIASNIAQLDLAVPGDLTPGGYTVQLLVLGVPPYNFGFTITP